MSILDNPEVIEKDLNQAIETKKRKEEELAAFLKKGAVICVTTTTDTPYLKSKIQEALKNATFPSLSSHKNRRIEEQPLHAFKKGDAWGFMKNLSKDVSDLILVLENVTRIPTGAPSIYDDKDFVEDLLIKSWMHEDINVGDSHIDRRNLTIILTSPAEDSEKLKKLAQDCHYNFDDSGRLETILDYLK